MHKDDIKKVLLTEEEIQTRMKELGQQITADYRDKNLVIVGLLKGAAVRCLWKSGLSLRKRKDMMML